MRYLALLPTIAVAFAAQGASAESFTFTVTNAPKDQIVAMTPGKPIAAGFFTSTAKAVYAGGKTSTSNADCAQWSTPDNAIFQGSGVCVYTEANGDKASIVFSCAFTTPDQAEANCWGALTGMAGSRAKKLGSITWHSKMSTDGKGSAVGVGMWND